MLYVFPSRTPPSHGRNEAIEKQASYIQEISLSRAMPFEERLATRHRGTPPLREERGAGRGWLREFLIDFRKSFQAARGFVVCRGR